MRTKKQSLELLKARNFVPSIVVDVGVATGTDGLYEVWPESHHVLVEGLPKFEGDLVRICQSLGSCEYLVALAGDRPGQIEIATSPTHVHAHVAADLAPVDWVRSFVPITTVDAITSARVLLSRETQILLKVDVDGPELSVLAGASATLACDCVVVIEAALLDEETARFSKIVQSMVGLGYEVFDIIEPIRRPGDEFLWQVDLVFVRRDATVRSSRDYTRHVDAAAIANEGDQASIGDPAVEGPQ